MPGLGEAKDRWADEGQLPESGPSADEMIRDLEIRMRSGAINPENCQEMAERVSAAGNAGEVSPEICQRFLAILNKN